MPERGPEARSALTEALQRLEANPLARRVSAAELAREAGVGRATLYRHPDLLRRLEDFVVRHQGKAAAAALLRENAEKDLQRKILAGLQANLFQ